MDNFFLPQLLARYLYEVVVLETPPAQPRQCSTHQYASTHQRQRCQMLGWQELG
jgi:hypothetical protein